MTTLTAVVKLRRLIPAGAGTWQIQEGATVQQAFACGLIDGDSPCEVADAESYHSVP